MDPESHPMHRRRFIALAGSALAAPSISRAVEAGSVPTVSSLTQGVEHLWQRTLETGKEHIQMHIEYADGQMPHSAWLSARVTERSTSSLRVQHDWHLIDTSRPIRQLFEAHTHPQTTAAELISDWGPDDLSMKERSILQQASRRRTIAPLSSLDLRRSPDDINLYPMLAPMPRVYRAAIVSTGIYVSRPLLESEVADVEVSVRGANMQYARSLLTWEKQVVQHRAMIASWLESASIEDLVGCAHLLRSHKSAHYQRLMFDRNHILRDVLTADASALTKGTRMHSALVYTIGRFIIESVQSSTFESELKLAYQFPIIALDSNRTSYLATASQTYRELSIAALGLREAHITKYDRATIQSQLAGLPLDGDDARFWNSSSPARLQLIRAAIELRQFMYFVTRAEIAKRDKLYQ